MLQQVIFSSLSNTKLLLGSRRPADNFKNKYFKVSKPYGGESVEEEYENVRLQVTEFKGTNREDKDISETLNGLFDLTLENGKIRKCTLQRCCLISSFACYKNRTLSDIEKDKLT